MNLCLGCLDCLVHAVSQFINSFRQRSPEVQVRFVEAEEKPHVRRVQVLDATRMDEKQTEPVETQQFTIQKEHTEEAPLEYPEEKKGKNIVGLTTKAAPFIPRFGEPKYSEANLPKLYEHYTKGERDIPGEFSRLRSFLYFYFF